jgi:putative aminopeptidase FrvX
MNKQFLKQLLEAPGPSSFEGRASKVFREQARGYGATVTTDTYGNTFATFNAGGSPKIMLAGHIDEIGLMITHIDSEGFLYFQPIGGWDNLQLVGQRVKILGYQGDLVGVISLKPFAMMTDEEAARTPKTEAMWLDIGAKDEASAKARVRVGDVAVVETSYLELLDNRVASRAIDNRVSAYIVLEAAHHAASENAKAEIVAVATVQEELSFLGAMTAAYALGPHVAIAVDVDDATDLPEALVKRTSKKPLGSGALIGTGSVIHQGVFRQLLEVAERHELPYAVAPNPKRTSTDADEIAKVRSGIPTGLVSVPTRYIHHSPNELVDLADVEHCITLLSCYIQTLDSTSSFLQPDVER